MQVAEKMVMYTKRYTLVAMQKVTYLRCARLLYIATRVRTWVFLKETRIHIKKLIFRVFVGIFRLWCLLESFS